MKPLTFPVAASDNAALVQLRAFIAESGLGPGARLPPERQLCEQIGVGRGELRRALARLEADGALWRHVGKGTFLSAQAREDRPDDAAALAKRVSPADAMRARAALEPAIAREAATHASADQILALRLTLERSRRAASWREYETLDNQFHGQVAEGAASQALLALFDQLNTLRRMLVWGRVDRSGARPAPDHPSFVQHERVVAAIEARDADAAQAAMRAHLRSVADRLLAG